ncbi:MAG: hypothetical protein Q4B36_01895 [Tissierellia bacterium]|nr:hypothetical protein [Tissierellia bacterium]
MIKFVLGPSGSGKTKWLIDQANEEEKKGNKNIVFVDSDEKHIFTLDYNVRLINARDFFVDSLDAFVGFLGGILARDYDIGKIYVDGIYDIVDINKENILELEKRLEELSEKCEAEFYIGLNWNKSDMPEELNSDIYELKIEG